MTNQPLKILYCNCTYAKVVPPETKKEVLRQLAASGVAFDTVADLCEMSACKDPMLNQIAESGNTRIAACFPRAVKWLFHSAKADLPDEGVDVFNMRDESPEVIINGLLADSHKETSS